jgi:hypothetical protein
MDTNQIYQDDRNYIIRESDAHLKKCLSCVGHQQYQYAEDCFEDAIRCGQEVAEDNDQFYLQEMFNTYRKYYAAFKRIKYYEGAKWCLLQDVFYLRRLAVPKEEKNRTLADIRKKYKIVGGDIHDIRARWQQSIG